jgi:ATP-dependent RNA helicase DDX60
VPVVVRLMSCLYFHQFVANKRVAGRRGFDLLGKVVFYGLPVDRVQRLVLSRLPALGGNFPLTSTTVLRLFNLLHGSNYAPYAVDAVKSLLHLSQISCTSDTGKSELMHHIRFSIDYLRRLSLLDRQGNPVNLFGLTNHLYYTEPSNFALAALIQANVIHKICKKASNMEDAKRTLLHLLCHLFGRRNLPRVYTTAENIRDLLAKSASKVILTPMSDRARKVLKDQDKTTLEIFNGYAIAFARQSADQLGPDVALPLSGVKYAGNSNKEPGTFVQYLRSTAIQVVGRSSFVANSGHNDVFISIDDLTRNVRHGIHLKEHGVPSFQHFTTDNAHALNAYILDFYNHGQTEPLVIANGIRRGELWYLLQDFTLTLKTIRASLAHMFITAADSQGADSADDLAIQGDDPAEIDIEDEGSPLGVLKRPANVSEDDWKVYQVVHSLTEDFDAKFRAMWA